MEGFWVVFFIIVLIAYIGLLIMEPEKHILGLVIIAVISAIFGSFYDTTGAKSDYDRKKKG